MWKKYQNSINILVFKSLVHGDWAENQLSPYMIWEGFERHESGMWKSYLTGISSDAQCLEILWSGSVVQFFKSQKFEGMNEFKEMEFTEGSRWSKPKTCPYKGKGDILELHMTINATSPTLKILL